MARRGHRLAVAGRRAAVLVQGHRADDRGDDRLGRRAGHPGAGVRQLPGAAPAAHRRHLGAGHVPGRRRAHRADRGQPDRRVPDRADRAGRGHRLLAARGQPLARGAGGGPGQRGRRDRGDEPRGPGRGVLRPDRGHRAAVDDRPAGTNAAQRRLRRRAGAAGVGGRLRHPAPGDPGHRRPAPGLAAAADRAPRQPGVLGLGARRLPAPLAGRAGRARHPGRAHAPGAVPAPG